MIKKYLVGVAILLLTLLFFAVVPELVSAASVVCYIGGLLCIAYPIAMYYLIKYFIQLLKTQS